MALQTQIIIDGADGTGSNYIAWAPVHSTISLIQVNGAANPSTVVLRNQNLSPVGQISFFDAALTARQGTLQLDLPVDGTPVDFFIAGTFGRPSENNKDAVIEVVEAGTNKVLSTTALMVRIRKNANKLKQAERDRFLSALAKLNDPSMGNFKKFPLIHIDRGLREAHFWSGFLPWHRAFMLDLERELQAIDPRVALPYWKFDEPAANLFTQKFMGVYNRRTGELEFDSSNPIAFWKTASVPKIDRRPRFDTRTAAALVRDELNTINFGSNNLPADEYEVFRTMESDPHGFAHTSFSGPIRDTNQAANDPLFFLLHSNVDRLWAKWQWSRQRYDSTNAATYLFQGAAKTPGATEVGHNLLDTMWPWNRATSPVDPDRPPTAPGGNFPPAQTVAAPGLTPLVADMIDFQGMMNVGANLGFGYDDVPFGL